MDVSFGSINPLEKPVLILKNAGGVPLGILGYAINVNVELKYNEISTIEFDLPAYVDGEKVPFYDDVVGMRVIELQSVGQFVLMNPEENGSDAKTVKSCKAYSLEYEFTHKKISMPNDTYRFWSITDPSDTVLGMIMETMPSWKVGAVPPSIEGIYRTFEINNENVYNFIKGTLQKTYNCIFDFNTLTRTIHVRDANDNPVDERVYLSRDNLIKEIELVEDTESVITRLDVNGAEGVNIRDVNPNGTNKIINLDYFMTTDNFSQELIDRYYSWKKLNNENREAFYARSIQYSMAVMQSVTEQAKLYDLQGEMTSLENMLAVTIQAIAQGLQKQSDMDAINADIEAKQKEIDDQKELIQTVSDTLDELMNDLKEISTMCNYNNYFTDEEIIEMDRYIKDGEFADSSFVPAITESYTDEGTGSKIDSELIDISGATISKVESLVNDTIYDIKNGSLTIGRLVTSDIVAACIDKKKDGSIVISFRLSNLMFSGISFPSGCISITGTSSSVQEGEGSLAITVNDGYQYFTMDASEYEARSISWELLEFGEALLDKLSKPTYTFTVSSANFLVIDDFIAFKNSLRLGERVYIDAGNGVLRPICIGVTYQYESPETFELEFSDSYVSGEASFKLVDLLEQSVSMGRDLDMNQYLYAQFSDSGAKTGIKEFMTSALDVAKNAIISSTEQAVSWDGAGLRLRKWQNGAHTIYEDEQIWINNNSIVMTDDSWRSAQMAIGKFYDENLGDCWGVVAPMLVGTVLAGSSLVIESEKKDGGTSVFKMDADGCRLYNSDFYIAGDRTSIALNPDIGIAIGDSPLYALDDSGTKVLVEDNAKFWADAEGNLHLRGRITATELIIASGDNLTDIDDFVKGYTSVIADGSEGIYFTSSDVAACIINTKDGIKVVGLDGTFFQLKNTAMGFFSKEGSPMLYYENGDMTLSGIIYASGGKIGGFTIGSPGGDIDEALYCGGTRGTSTSTGMSADPDWAFWAGDGKFRVTQNGYVYAEDGYFDGVLYARSGQIGGFTIGSPGGGISEALYCGGERGSNLSTGMSADLDWAFWAGDGAFRVDQNGSLFASKGKIGGFTIGSPGGDIEEALYCGGQIGASTSTGISATNPDWAFWAGNGIFRVTQTGELHASNVDFAGGKIGGFTIGSPGGGISEGLYCGGTRGSSTSTGLSADKEWAFWAGDGKFRVTQNGALYADVGTFRGEVYAKNVVAGGEAGYIEEDQIGNGSVTPSKLDRVYATQEDFLIQARNIEINAKDIKANAESITANADQIKFESGRLNDFGTWVGTQFEQHQGSISLIARNEEDLRSKLTVEANRISLVVEGEGANAKIKPAAIVASINDDESEIRIIANKIVLDGYVKASQLDVANAKIDNLISGTTIASYIQASSLRAASSFNCLGYSTAWRTIRIDGVGDVYVLSHY